MVGLAVFILGDKQVRHFCDKEEKEDRSKAKYKKRVREPKKKKKRREKSLKVVNVKIFFVVFFISSLFDILLHVLRFLLCDILIFICQWNFV